MSENILENYLKQVEEDKKNENNNLPNGVSREDMSDEQYELYQKELNKLRQQSNRGSSMKPTSRFQRKASYLQTNWQLRMQP